VCGDESEESIVMSSEDSEFFEKRDPGWTAWTGGDPVSTEMSSEFSITTY
jgi:hypothetical protein